MRRRKKAENTVENTEKDKIRNNELEAMFLDYLDAHEARCAKGNYYPWGRAQTYCAMHWAVDQWRKMQFEDLEPPTPERDPYQDDELKS